MKSFQIIALFALLIISERLSAATNGMSPELLSYNLKTSVEAYDRVGRKNPKWDADAKACLKTFAELRSVTNGMTKELVGSLNTNLPTSIARGCDDPMVRYLHARFVLGSTKSAAEMALVFNEIASALEKSAYPAILKYYGWLR